MRKKAMPILAMILGIVTIVAGVAFIKKLADPYQGLPWVSWAELATLDIHSQFVAPELKAREESDIKLAGFVVPLSDDFKEIKEFLLVPDSMSCIHVPPPPANQMVLVQIDNLPVQLAYGPVWLRGRLQIQSINSEFGTVGYRFKATHAKRYQDEPW